MKGDAHKALHNQTGDTNPNWNKCNTFLVLLSSQKPIFAPRMKRGITNGYLFHHNATQTYANGTEVT